MQNAPRSEDGEALSSNRHGARCSALPVLFLFRARLSIALSGQHCRRSGVLGLARSIAAWVEAQDGTPYFSGLAQARSRYRGPA